MPAPSEQLHQLPAQAVDVGDVAWANAGALVPLGGADLARRTLVGPEKVAEAERVRSRAYAPKTLHAYRRDWEHFAAYCAGRGARPTRSCCAPI